MPIIYLYLSASYFIVVFIYCLYFNKSVEKINIYKADI